MSKLNRIAIFAANADHMYVNMLLGLKRGFAELGVEAYVGWGYLNGKQLSTFVDNFQPDILLEIDRFRSQIENFDDPIRHAVWIQNHFSFGRRINANASGSDIVFTIYAPDEMEFDQIANKEFDVLHLAVDPEVFRKHNDKPIFDFNLIGHLYPPIDDQTLNEDVRSNDQVIFKMGEMVKAFIMSDIFHYNFELTEITRFIEAFFLSKGFVIDPVNIPQSVRFLLDEYLIRQKDRKLICDAILRVSSNVAFYGNIEWLQWPEFGPYYRGSLWRSSELVSAYCASRLTVHNGPVTMHPRVLEALACGMPVMVNRTWRDHTPFGIAAYLEPDRDYIAYDFAEFEDVARRALKDQAWCRSVAENGQARILDGHTWRHRAQAILHRFNAS